MSQQPTLKTIQQEMLSWLQHRDEAIKSHVGGTTKVPAETRLNIYANAYRFRLIEALQDTFPALHTLLGDEEMFKLGNAYIDAWPSKHFSIRYFGHQLAHFLDQAESYKAQPVLAEMAHFEWLLRDAFDAADTQSMKLEELQAIEAPFWPDLKFTFHPSLQRLDLNYNTPQLWQAIDSGQPPIEIEKNDYPLPWCIWRKDLRTLYRSLPVDEAWAMDALRENRTFAAICTGVCEWVDEQHAASRVAGFIQTWSKEGLISGTRI